MSRRVPLFLASVVLALPATAHAAAGDLDPSWGGLFGNTPGTITTDVGGVDDEGYGVAIQADGRIVVAGYTNGTFAVTRYNADGSIDTTFNADGAHPGSTSIGSACGSPDPGSARGVLIQPDGKIVVGGYESTPGCPVGFALMRFNSDGTVDPSFGGQNGDLPGTTTAAIYDVSYSATKGFALALQPATNSEGFKIVVVGAVESNGEGFMSDYALGRFNPDGTLDATFHSGDSNYFGPPGTYITNFQDPCEREDAAYGVAIQPDGKIVAVGHEEVDVKGATSPPFSQFDFAVARYTADGFLDTTGFNAAGGTGDCGVAKAGTNMTDFEGGDDEAHGVVVQSDGHILVAGYTSTTTAVTSVARSGRRAAPSGNGSRDWVIARYNSDGSLDTTWGDGGHVFTSFGDFDDEANAIVLQPDGKFLVSGFTSLADQTKDYALARYNADGTLDTTFGTGGKVTTDFAGHGTDVAQAMLLQPDGKIVLAGWRSHSPPDFSVARYLTDPKPTPTPIPTPPPTITVPSSNPPPSCGDTTPPVVTIASLQHKTLYAKGKRASLKVTATDNGKLVTDPSNAKLVVSTGHAGRFEVEETAVDSCGNRATARFHYRVVSGPLIRIVSPSNCVRSSVTASVTIRGGSAMRSVIVTIAGKPVYTGKGKHLRVTAETSLMSARSHGIAVYVRDSAGHRRHAFVRFRVCPPPKALFTG